MSVTGKDAPTASARNFGLDLVRGIAISLVLAAHCLLFLFPFFFQRVREAFGILGCLGVEIFFVLSGFLIGQLVVKEVLDPPSWKGLGHFWVRRWFRTLPPYFLILFLRSVIGNPLHWRFFVFLQNFDPNVVSSFPISWSLAVEEWFYLLAPLILLVVALCGRGRLPRTFFLTCVGIAAAALIGRIAYVLASNPPWEPTVRQHTFLRMDTLMIGVLLGGLRAYRRASYDRVALRRKFLFAVGVAGLGIAIAWLFVEIRNFTLNGSFWMRAFFFDLLSISIGLLIVSLESSPMVNSRWASRRWANAVRFVSLSSYSLYLIHLTVFEILLSINARTRTVPWAFGLMALAVVGSLLVGGAMYRWFERPVLRLRDRMSVRTPIERPAVAAKPGD